jgi:hypothetical protein
MEKDDIHRYFAEIRVWNTFYFLPFFGTLLTGNQCRDAVRTMADGIDEFAAKDEGPIPRAEVAVAFRMFLAYLTLFLERRDHLTPDPPTILPVTREERYRCSFCEKKPGEDLRLFPGQDVFICAECVTRCMEILNGTKEPFLRCSFCGNSQYQVKKLIAGPKVFICNECVDICVEVIADDEAKEKEATGEDLKKDDGKDPDEKGGPVEIPLI